MSLGNDLARLVWRQQRRRDAYRRVFGLDEHGRPSGDGAVVLRDLMRFCRLLEPSTRHDLAGRVDPLATAHQEGRREVAQRIVGMLHVSDRDLWRMREQEQDSEELT